jgi:hypothetical protein
MSENKYQDLSESRDFFEDCGEQFKEILLSEFSIDLLYYQYSDPHNPYVQAYLLYIQSKMDKLLKRNIFPKKDVNDLKLNRYQLNSLKSYIASLPNSGAPFSVLTSDEELFEAIQLFEEAVINLLKNFEIESEFDKDTKIRFYTQIRQEIMKFNNLYDMLEYLIVFLTELKKLPNKPHDRKHLTNVMGLDLAIKKQDAITILDFEVNKYKELAQIEYIRGKASRTSNNKINGDYDFGTLRNGVLKWTAHLYQLSLAIHKIKYFLNVTPTPYSVTRFVQASGKIILVDRTFSSLEQNLKKLQKNKNEFEEKNYTEQASQLILSLLKPE